MTHGQMAALRQRQKMAQRNRDDIEINAGLQQATKGFTQPGIMLYNLKNKDLVIQWGMEVRGAHECPRCAKAGFSGDGCTVYQIDKDKGFEHGGYWCGFCLNCARRENDFNLHPVEHFGIDLSEYQPEVAA